MSDQPASHHKKRLLTGSAVLSLFGILIYKVTRDIDQRTGWPEGAAEQAHPGTGAEIAQYGESGLQDQEVDPQWVLTLPDGKFQKQYAIEPGEVYSRKADNRRVFESVPPFSSIEDMERLFYARAGQGDEVPHIVLYPLAGPRNEHTRRLLGRRWPARAAALYRRRIQCRAWA